VHAARLRSREPAPIWSRLFAWKLDATDLARMAGRAS